MKSVETEVCYLEGMSLGGGYGHHVWKTYRWWKPTHWFKTKRYRLILENGPSKTVTVGGSLPNGGYAVLKKVAQDRWEVES